MRATDLAAQCGKVTRPATNPQGLSPVVSAYQGWMSGRATPSSLARPVDVFQTNAFGPQTPIRPNNIDLPEDGAQRPRPRRWQYAPGYDLPSSPGMAKLVSFANLRMYADLYSVARACIQIRKQELIGLGWDIVPSASAHENIRGDSAALDDFKTRRDIAVKFWQRPDPNYNNFANWFFTALDDLLTVDAMSLYLHPTRVPHKGPFGSDLAALEVIDGTTILPLVDIWGGSPRPPAPAYQQYLFGVPRVELMAPIMQDDESRIKELGEPINDFRGDQLLYLPYNTRSWTMYGYSQVEQGIVPIITGLKRQQYRQEFFTEGSTPAVWLTGPPDYTAAQLQQLQDSQNLLAGDLASRWKVRTLPHGSSIEQMKKIDTADQSDQIIWEEVMMVFDIKPQELGLSPGGRSQGLGGKGAVEGMERASQRQSLLPLVRWLEDSLFNYVIQHVWGQTDMRFKFEGLEVKDDQLDKAQMLDTFVRNGTMTIDEVRAEIDLEPYGTAETSRPNVYLVTGVVPVELVTSMALAEAELASEDQAPETGDLTEQQKPSATQAPLTPAGSGQSDDGSPSAPTSTKPPAAGMPRPAATASKPEPAMPPSGRRASGMAKVAEEEALAELKAFKNFLRHRED